MGVALGLVFDHGDVFARFVALGFDHPDRLARHKQQVVGRAGIRGVFTHRHTAGRAQVEAAKVLHHPAGQREFGVDDLPGFCFGRHAGVLLLTFHRGCCAPPERARITIVRCGASAF